jgi:hypothetical protein
VVRRCDAIGGGGTERDRPERRRRAAGGNERGGGLGCTVETVLRGWFRGAVGQPVCGVEW